MLIDLKRELSPAWQTTQDTKKYAITASTALDSPSNLLIKDESIAESRTCPMTVRSYVQQPGLHKASLVLLGVREGP